MKSKKFNLYSSIASLLSTFFLLVCIVLAWYVSNDEATATGITGSTSIINEESTGNVSEVYYFDITKVVDNDGSKTYTVANECKGTKISNVSMGKYDALYSEAHQLLMVIKLKDVSNYSVKTQTTATSYLGSTLKDANGDFVLKAENNPISSVISFVYVNPNDVTLSDAVDKEYGINFPTSITTSSEEKSFVEEDTQTDAVFNANLNQNLTLVESENTQYIYIILDYVEEAIEDIYSKNIGNEALNGISEYEGDYITYACDFTISVDKV